MITTLYLAANNKLETIEFESDAPESTKALMKIINLVNTNYFGIKIKPGQLIPYEKEVLKWIGEMQQHEHAFSYSSYYQQSEEHNTAIPTIEYSPGSIRDDFNFGALVLIKTSVLSAYLKWESNTYAFAGWYAFRLFVSRQQQLHQYNGFTHAYSEQDLRKSGEKQFDYVDPKNRARQIELEKAATIHLAEIGAKVSPPFNSVDFDAVHFETEASVIIPVLNREKTIAEAIASVLNQETNFKFNLIIVDNHSTDRTAEIISSINDKRIIHVVPEATNLGIGGCWNEGIHHHGCGRFAVQLDSDDLYLNELTLQKVVDKFREEKCAMVIGSYQMVNFKLEEIPPGIIDHREWTNDNGPNNALRINGLGAPRAFYTPVLREIGFPNVSYGEDYAVGLAISRSYKVGRIYEPLYLCRRWDDNTDANLSIEKMNAHNRYKDSIRSNEITIRKKAD